MADTILLTQLVNDGGGAVLRRLTLIMLYAGFEVCNQLLLGLGGLVAGGLGFENLALNFLGGVVNKVGVGLAVDESGSATGTALGNVFGGL